MEFILAMLTGVRGVLAENGESDYEELSSESNSSRTDFLQQYLYEPILLYVWRRLSVHLVWDGLPTHLICWPKLEFVLFYVLNTLSFLFSGTAVYFHVYDGFFKRKLGDLSKKIFGLSKAVTAFIFTQGCALVLQELFVPAVIAISATVVELGYPSGALDSEEPPAVDNNKLPAAGRLLASAVSAIVVIAGIVAMVCWIVTKETFRLDAENLQRKLDNLHFFVRESSRLKRLVQALCLTQFVVWLECGGDAFEYWLDKFLCILLLLAALLAEVLSGLYLSPGTTWWRNSNINIPSLNKPNWLWWLVHMFAFEMGYIGDRCGAQGVGIGVASCVALTRYLVPTLSFAIIANCLPALISENLRWDETTQKTVSSHCVLVLFLLVEAVMCICASGWGEVLGDQVAIEAKLWPSWAAFITNWFARALVVRFFWTTLEGIRALIAGILNSKLPIAKLMSDFKTLQIKTGSDARSGGAAEENTFKYSLPHDFQAGSRVRRAVDRLVKSFFECKDKPTPMNALTFVKELKNINRTGFHNRKQSMEFYIDAKFELRVKDSVSEDIMANFQIEPFALIVHRHVPWVPLVNIVETLSLLFKVEVYQDTPGVSTPSSKRGSIRFQRAKKELPKTRDSAKRFMRDNCDAQIKKLEVLKKAVETLGDAQKDIDSLYKMANLVVDLCFGLESSQTVLELLDETVLPALIQGVNIYNALNDVCKAETHLDLEIGSETQYTFWRHAVVELAFSLIKRLIDHTDKRISDGLTSLAKAKASLINRRPPQQEWVQLTRGLLHTVAFFCKLLMATSFNKQLKWCEGLSDEGADQGAFETGMVRLRCEVRLDILFAMCAQLATNLKKMKWFQKALSLGCLLRFNVADGTFDLPLDAIRGLIPRGSDGVEAGRVSSGGTSWLNQTHEQVRKYVLEVLKQVFTDGKGTIFSLIEEFNDVGNTNDEAAVKHISKMLARISESYKRLDATQSPRKPRRKRIKTLRAWLGSSTYSLSLIEDKLRNAGWGDENFRHKTEKDIPDSIIGGFRERLIKLISATEKHAKKSASR